MASLLMEFELRKEDELIPSHLPNNSNPRKVNVSSVLLSYFTTTPHNPSFKKKKKKNL